MQIHNALTPAQRARASDALRSVVSNLPNCEPSPGHSGGGLLFTIKFGTTGVETLRLRLRKHEVRTFIAIRHGRTLRRTSFVEHLRGGDPTSVPTFAEAVSRLSEWRRHLEYETSDDATRGMQEKRSNIVKAATGAATRLDDRWESLAVYAAFDQDPPRLFLRGPDKKTSFFCAPGAQAGSSGTMSQELVRELSSMSDHLFVTASKPSSNPGIQIHFGSLPSIQVDNDLSPMDLFHVLHHAEAYKLSLHP